MKEIWENIPGYEEIYKISNFGIVKSLDREIKYKDGRKTLHKGRKLCYLNNKGYLIVYLWKNNKYKIFRVHRLVLLVFKGHSKLQVNHKNGIKTDNRLENLEYCTQSENQKHAFKLGLNNTRDEKNGFAKLKKKNVIFIRKNKNIYTNIELANMFNISKYTVNNIIYNKNIWRECN